MDEVNKLLAAHFIREVYYLEWLANVSWSKRHMGNGECALISQI